ncbi:MULTISPECIES: YxiJ-like family protein [Bacillus cereus group]|uniref:Group-specific protein n=2 Tax=Bacillus cereus TaxID=1396 RepID=A0A9X7CNG6_BACCE|nr:MULTISPECIES: YxiJ-like family protein [Bacillus cereus group]MCC2506756.1 YxiJ-like family protein [Bacillus cereus]MDA2208836.1 YxiJ-like family protein [Bacillus cereus]MDA2222583.1 YxiJ-like family protein [Bacillus cereus]MDA2250463.1 YxiJ-like family protein [Bacillus cereus]MDA2278472.1 YxiJ-like family protein [Bacillus cereus]
MKLGKQIIFKELQKMHIPLHKPFPYRATAKLQRDLKSKFTEDDCINANFNHYWMHIAATLNSVLNGNEQNITFQQIKWLRKSFFEWFPQYRFLETEIMNYPILYRDFMNYEKTRKLLLYYLTE